MNVRVPQAIGNFLYEAVRDGWDIEEVEMLFDCLYKDRLSCPLITTPVNYRLVVDWQPITLARTHLAVRFFIAADTLGTYTTEITAFRTCAGRELAYAEMANWLDDRVTDRFCSRYGG